MKLNPKIKSFTKKALALILPVLGSFIIVTSWNWYHVPHRPMNHLIRVTVIGGMALIAAYIAGKKFLAWLLRRTRRHAFWHTDFMSGMDFIYFFLSLIFLIFFFKNQLHSLTYLNLALVIFLCCAYYVLGKHPNALPWQKTHRAISIFFIFLLLLSSVLQFIAYKLYILNLDGKYFNIVLFRAVTISMIWMASFSLASLLFLHLKGKKRNILLGIWVASFVFVMLVWAVNIGVLYFSGLNFSPLVTNHAEGGGTVVVSSSLTYVLAVLFLLIISLFIIFLRHIIKNYRELPRHHWSYYHTAIIVLSLIILFTSSSVKNTPEFTIARSFYNYFKGYDKSATVAPYILEKLRRFGLSYHLDQQAVAHKEKVFTASKKLLPDQLSQKRPNIIILFLESFTGSLTGIYNTKLTSFTPNLDKLAQDPDTTVFTNTYNTSFPTVTGVLSELCSFLPPTGHTEIATEKRLQSFRLLCLPKILRDKGGYQSAVYVTDVQKDFANKDSILKSAGMDATYGREELRKLLNYQEPLGWGYTDHQLFPLFNSYFLKNLKEPFLLTYSTIDTHAPFTLSKDMPELPGSNPVERSFYSTDDAFGKFWDEFKKTEQYKNTILIAIADHPVFTSAYRNEWFPGEAQQHTEFEKITFMIHVPGTILPKTVDTYASSIDLSPTILQMLNVNVPNSFEGHSIFDDRPQYPNLLGMYERSLWSSEATSSTRKNNYGIIDTINCGAGDFSAAASSPLTLCEYIEFYQWKRRMLEEGRFWDKLEK